LGLVIFKGVVTGFILSIMIGPVFFMLIETSIVKGIRAALAFDIGVLLSDIIYISIVFFFLSEVTAAIDENKNILTVIGGIILIIFGVFNALKKQEAKLNTDFIQLVHQPRDYGVLLMKGFFLNFLNPMVLFYWFAVLTIDTDRVALGGWQAISFIAIILLTFFSVDILKIFGAKKLRVFITPSVLKRLNLILGAILMIFGIVLIIRGFVTK
jgi:threonine/homoserine/homoserine lactone efflux protein